jgi:hypothetical protein
LHPDQRALPIPELAEAGAIYGYSFILYRRARKIRRTVASLRW